MTIEEAIKLLKIERKCVRHADVCGRECDKCCLCQDTDELLEMYDNVTEKYLTQLKEYQQLEEQGRLIKLPCKIGSVLYEINDLTGFITERDIDKIEIFECSTPHIFLTSGRYYRMSASRDFGRTVFATKSEAEAKLKELRGGENGSME